MIEERMKGIEEQLAVLALYIQEMKREILKTSKDNSYIATSGDYPDIVWYDDGISQAS